MDGSQDKPQGGGREGAFLDVVWRIVRAGTWVIVLATCATALAAFLSSAARDKRYTTSASVLFDNSNDILSDSTDAGDVTRVAATNEDLLGLRVVAERATRLLNREVTADDVAGAIAIVSTPNSDLVRIRATAGNAVLSARIANAYGQAFIDFRRETGQAQVQDAIDRARTVQARLTGEELAGTQGAALRDQIARLRQAKELRIAGARLVQRATPRTAEVSPKPLRTGILGAVIGAVLGFGLAALRDRRDRAVGTVDDVEQTIGRPVLARIPRSLALARGGHGGLGAEEAEAFRVLRASLRHLWDDTARRSLLITSAGPAEGKSTVARGLAETMAGMGDSVVLVEADLHWRRNGEPPGSTCPGLSGVLMGAAVDESLEDVEVLARHEDREDAVLARHEDRALVVLRSGTPPANPSELLESDRMRDVLAELQMRYDIVIVDGPSVPPLSDSLTLARQVSGVIIVSAAGRTADQAIRDFLGAVELLGGRVLGLVVNFMPRSDRSADSARESVGSGQRPLAPRR